MFTPGFSQKKAKNEDPKDIYLYTPKKYSDDVISTLKTTKTVFFYKNESGKSLDSLKEAITSAWDLTPIIFDTYFNIEKYYSGTEYSYFVIEGGKTHYSVQKLPGPEGYPGSKIVNATHFYLVLRLPFEGGLSRIELYPDSKTLLADYDKREVYYKGSFYNWSPVFLKAHLEVLSTNLKNNTRIGLFDDKKSDSLKELLSSDTLYISASDFLKFNIFSGKESVKSSKLFDEYRFPYRVCTDDELYTIFVTQKRGRFLFEYVKSSSWKFITVYDCKNKDILYRKNSNGHNLRGSDLSAIR